ncbi:maleylacetoacetate isomerase [Parvibium lacunae]|uniref:Maleylacetoacetate isomerase n=1 Tax=Parvibium lacunae TaxID=1888893 RepID=A0A368L0J7_9BURK|nr:maleylacetoacetate isomerase [Parvibium lacunae]RCS57090.1 maleylacetoacetate isomerase [Parvibium lacunae]
MDRLYTYFRSSAAYRVRIALNIKNLPYEAIPVHLVRAGGQQFSPAYRARNPEARVPAWETTQGVLTQSLAIMEYLEEVFPHPSLLPGDAWQRAQIRAFCQVIACDIHPLNNTGVLNYQRAQPGFTQAAQTAWIHHWILRGLQALETRLAGQAQQPYCFGPAPTMADCCLIPQIFNALRYDCPLETVPQLVRIYQHAMTNPIFINASPAQQPDAET